MLYDSLMAAVKKRTDGMSFDTVTIVWMQGETDTGKKGSIYISRALIVFLPD